MIIFAGLTRCDVELQVVPAVRENPQDIGPPIGCNTNMLTISYNMISTSTRHRTWSVEIWGRYWMVSCGFEEGTTICPADYNLGRFPKMWSILKWYVYEKGRYWMVCCEFGRVLQSVQDSTYESKDDVMMCGRLGEMVHYEDHMRVIFWSCLDDLELNWWWRLYVLVHVIVSACEMLNGNGIFHGGLRLRRMD